MLDKNLLKLLGKNKKYIYIIVFLMILTLLCSLSLIFVITYAIKTLATDKDYTKYIYCGIIAFIALVLRFISTYYTNLLKDYLGRKVKKDLRERTYQKIISIGKRHVGELNLSGLTQVSIEGIEQLDTYYSVYLPQFFYSMIAPLILFIIAVFLDWKVAIVLLACVPLIPLSIVAVSKYAKRIFAKYWNKYTSMGDSFLDGLQGLKDLKIFEADGEYNDKLNISAEEFRKITMKVLVMQLASVTIMDLVAYGGAGTGIAITILDLQAGILNPYYALFITLIAVEFFLPLRALGSAFHIAMNGLSAGRKIDTLLNTKEVEWKDNKVDKTDIKFENVFFSYDNKTDVLKNINISFKEKGLTGVVGRSGCGKSTIVKLLIGEVLPRLGSITLGNSPLHYYSRESFYDNVALVDYDSYIFNESIKDNFKLAKEDVGDEEIYSALKKVNLYDFVINNGGINKIINEDGNNISGGQKQRLALAINLVKTKKIYIFDEATSNIDIESEEIIMKNIYSLAKKANVIVISHRLENVKDASNIYYLEDGEVKESGTHQELMGKKKGYYNLYLAQREAELSYLNNFKVNYERA